MVCKDSSNQRTNCAEYIEQANWRSNPAIVTDADYKPPGLSRMMIYAIVQHFYSAYIEKFTSNEYKFTEVFDDFDEFSEVKVTYNGREDMMLGLSNAPLSKVFKILPYVHRTVLIATNSV